MQKFTWRKLLFLAMTVSMVAALSVTAVFAATKTVDLHSGKVPFAGTLLVGGCNGSVDLVGTLDVDLVAWDNGHFIATISLDAKVVDAAGNKVGTAHEEEIQIGGPGTFSLPFTFEDTGTVTCDGTGQVVNFQFGFTVDENLDFHFH